MRRFIFGILLIILLFQFSHAGFLHSWGVKFGLNIGYRKFDDWGSLLTDKDKNIGFNAVFFLELIDIDNLNLLTEVQYKMLRMNERYFGNSDSPDVEVWNLNGLDYLSFPILLKIGYPIKNIIPFLCSGPRLDMLLKVHYDKLEHFNRDLADEFKRVVFGFDIGGGIKIKIGENLCITPEFRFCIDITKSKGIYHDSASNRAYLFMLGFNL